MRRLRYHVAMSLDGFIAGPNGEFDWIPADPSFDFNALYAQFGTAVMGRKTYLVGAEAGPDMEMPFDVIVFSRTLRQQDHPKAVIVNSDPVEYTRRLKEKPGKDIWLFGGGELFRTLLEAGVVDTVEPAVMPILLGGGLPMLPPTKARFSLSLTKHTLYEKSGMVLLEYDVRR